MQKPPPQELEGARVILWAWSEDPPFFLMPGAKAGESIPIHGLAVCQYDYGKVYRFSCNASWEVENDSPYPTTEAARVGPSEQFDIHRVKWSSLASEQSP